MKSGRRGTSGCYEWRYMHKGAGVWKACVEKVAGIFSGGSSDIKLIVGDQMVGTTEGIRIASHVVGFRR